MEIYANQRKDENKMANKEMIALEMQRFFQTMAQKLELDDETAKEISSLYEPWRDRKSYPVGKILKYGFTSDGEPQLYKVIKDHVSENDLKPDTATSLFRKI